MEVGVRVLLWLVVGSKFLSVVMLNTEPGRMLNVVEQLIVLVLDVSNDLLSVVEFDVMWVGLRVVVLVMTMVLERLFLPVSVSTVAGKTVEDWLVDAVLADEVAVMLDSVSVVVGVLTMHWVEWAGV